MTTPAAVEWYCAECGNLRTARRCGCQGAAADTPAFLAPVETEAARLLRLARIHRAAAERHPASAAANLADAERLEAMVGDRA